MQDSQGEVGKRPLFFFLQKSATDWTQKCDEVKPTCKRCVAYGVFCNYEAQHSNLQLSVNGATIFQVVKMLPSSLNLITPKPASPFAMPSSSKFLGSDNIYRMKDQVLELLNKFQTRTVFTITFDKSLPIYQNEVIKLSCAVSDSFPPACCGQLT